jgi:hypothetical protein
VVVVGNDGNEKNADGYETERQKRTERQKMCPMS